MKISQETLLTVLEAAGRASVATLLRGDPGEGKSSLIAALADARGVPCETVIGALREPSDFNGLPVVTPAGVHLEPPSWAKRLAADPTRGGVLFLDELTSAAPGVQAAMLGVVLERRVGDLLLPQRVQVIAAANPPDRAAEGWDLPAPMANRLLHIDYQLNTDDWIDGMTSGFRCAAPRLVLDMTHERRALSRAQVASFIRKQQTNLRAYPDATTAGVAAAGRAWPSPRTWTLLADTLAVLPPDDTDAALVAATGLVGEGVATAFIHWRAAADLPEPATVIADPDAVDWRGLPEHYVFAVLDGVVAHCAACATKDAWRAACDVLAVAAANGRADAGTVAARALVRCRPDGVVPTARFKTAFAPVLTSAGLIGGAR